MSCQWQLMPPQMILLKSFLISRAIRKKWLIHSFLWPEQDLDPDLSKCRFPRWLSDHHWPILNWLPVAGEYWNLEGIMLRFCTMHCVSQSSSVAVTAFVILPHPSRHLSRPRLPRPSSDKHAELLCHSVIQQARESEREVREITPVHCALFLFD